MPHVEDLLRPELADIKPYLPTAGEFRIRLDANEAPPLFGPEVGARLAEAFARVRLDRYPDATSGELRTAVAARLGVEPEEVLLGVGSDEIITFLMTAFARPRRGSEPPAILTTTPTFVMYRLSARLRGQRVVEVPLDAEWDLAEESLLRGIDMSEPHLIFIASPNNPTGTMATRSRLERVIEAAEGSLVVIDEAYVNYAERDQLELFRRYDNVVILRTLSKIGFAALRVGWLVGPKKLVAALDKVRPPYNINVLTQASADFLLDHLDVLDAQAAELRAERTRLAQAVAALPGATVFPSAGNFLLVRVPDAAAVFDALLTERVLIKNVSKMHPLLAECVRLTVGSADENARLLAALKLALPG